MNREDSTGQDFLQDSALADSFLVSTATKARRASSQFGWPMLVLFAAAPVNPMNFQESVRIFFVMGLPAVLLGFGLRLWARGFQRSDGFVMDGPYRYVRNPVELGAVMAYLGAGVILGVKWWFNLSSAALAILFMSFVSIAYERGLYLRMGGSYLRYAQRVRRWFPSRYPATNRSNKTYALSHGLFHERESLFWVLGFGVVFAVRKRYGI